MPTIDQNLAAWDQHYGWSAQGDEWSRSWGTPDAQWHGSLLPRLRHFLPAMHILEIAPGYGRWTQFLAGLCDRLTIVDLSPACIDACQKRFAEHGHIEYVVNDGLSLSAVGDATIDLVFSFDSLVHAESEVIGSYLAEIRRVLTPNGIAFIHHSNIGEFKEQFEREAALPEEERERLRSAGKLPVTHWRAFTMTADRFDELATDVGLRCIGQELIEWSHGRLTDAISVVTQPGSRFERPRRVVRNLAFSAEARSIRSGFAAFSEAGLPADPSPVAATGVTATESHSAA
jgi:SAM-dependent methyltransferase